MERSAERDRVVPSALDPGPRGRAVGVIGAALVCVHRRRDHRDRLTRIAERSWAPATTTRRSRPGRDSISVPVKVAPSWSQTRPRRRPGPAKGKLRLLHETPASQLWFTAPGSSCGLGVGSRTNSYRPIARRRSLWVPNTHPDPSTWTLSRRDTDAHDGAWRFHSSTSASSASFSCSASHAVGNRAWPSRS